MSRYVDARELRRQLTVWRVLSHPCEAKEPTMTCSPPPCPDEQEYDVAAGVLARLHLEAWLARARVIESLIPQEWFMGTPDRWYQTPHWRCTAGHVSTSFLKSEQLGRAACLAAGCQQPVRLTFPEDTEDCHPTL